jgi:hypothetical protein
MDQSDTVRVCAVSAKQNYNKRDSIGSANKYKSRQLQAAVPTINLQIATNKIV